MSVVRVKDFWLNPDMVVGIWHEELTYADNEHYWRVTLRCEEGQVWQWKHPTEEDAVRAADSLADQVNGGPKYAVGRQPKDIPYEETLR